MWADWTAQAKPRDGAWQRFLGLAAVSPLCAKDDLPEKDCAEAAARLGCASALLASPRAARTAVRIATSLVTPGKEPQRLVPSVLPLLRIGFKGSVRLTGTRGDLLALLSSLRFAQCARSMTNASQLSEARRILTASLAADFDVSPLLPELRRIAEGPAAGLRRGKALMRKLDTGIAEAKTSGSAAVLTELIEALADKLPYSDLARLVSFSGLLLGEDEQVDAKAAAARARGDLFFLDTDGEVPLESLLAGGSAAAHEAQAQLRKRTLGELEGVEELRTDVAADVLPAMAEEEEEQEEEKAEAAEVVALADDSSQSARKRFRRRQKSAA
ncbi:unnamed protein product [Effrenium voratum]|uniref:Uncharacterized protein n=1 Tax=Effrenium voratum TaxID=2562239 RepID=A0AA36NB53_9DINO|nr:unnamed protein product [Effrenium voratum]